MVFVLQLTQFGLQGDAALEESPLLLQAASEGTAYQLLQLLLHAQMIILQLAELHENILIRGAADGGGVANIILAKIHGS